MAAKKVNIRPEVSVLSVFPHLNYKPWYAMAEFVDNAVQSYVANYAKLRKLEGPDYRLRVDIRFSANDGGRITVRDNAAGISSADYERAFKTAAAPVDRSGLSEFGVGMKSAACWFARSWTVRTTAIDESVERFIAFDVNSIVQTNIEELEPEEAPTKASSHFTEISLTQLHSIPQTRTIAKIKEHLAHIYRIFIRTGELVLRFNDEELQHTQPKVLTASIFSDDNAPSVPWSKKVDIDFGDGRRVYGFAALRETGSTSDAGFALFRRKRLIEGSADDGYRPEYIFRKSNSYTYQRLFGELHIEGFEVSHTKDGIRWGEQEELFLDRLKTELNKAPLPLLDQAERYRSRVRAADVARSAETVLASTATVIQRDVPTVIEKQLLTEPLDDELELLAELPKRTVVTTRTMCLSIEGRPWKVTAELTTDDALGDWLSISENSPIKTDADERIVEIRVSLAHPFMARFAGNDPDLIEPLIRIAAGLALAEISARAGGVKMAGVVRARLNELLLRALHKV